MRRVEGSKYEDGKTKKRYHGKLMRSFFENGN
jgi:hypothetical protein